MSSRIIRKARRVKRRSRHGVAIIIAELLLVAITVVGGILVFVFAQDVFSNSQVEMPAIESVTFIGYDARDVAIGSLVNHAGTSLTGQGSAATTDSRISVDDEVAFYFKNTGTRDLVISSLKVAGEAYAIDSATSLAADAPDSGEYSIVDGNSATATRASSVLPAGAETTVVASIVDSPLKIGRSYSVEITTGNGAVFKFSFLAGIQRG